MISYAVNILKSILPHANVTWDLVSNYSDSTCEGSHTALDKVLQVFKTDGNSSIFIGPTCSLMCETVGLVAAKNDVVLISPACIDISLSNKSLYPTFLRTRDIPLPMILLIQYALKQFQWTRIGMIVFAYQIFLDNLEIIAKNIVGTGVSLYINIIQLAEDNEYSPLFGDLSRSLNSLKSQTRGKCSPGLVCIYF